MSAMADVPAAQSFAAALKRYRLAANLSQTELAERASMSRSAISALERGLKRRPHRYTVQSLADALYLSLNERAALQAAARAPISPPAAQTTEIIRHPSRTPFIGRADEMIRLRRHLERAEPALLALAGEPGIGKSRLLHEVAQYSCSVGWNTLIGHCRQQNIQHPYAPLVDALAAWIHGRSPPLLRADLDGCGWLARLLPELAEQQLVTPPSWSFTPEQERHLLFAAIQRFLVNVAGAAGTLLLLDDLHWAGADTLALMESLTSSAGGAIRLVVAYRNTDEGQESLFATLLSDLVGDGKAEQMELAPLCPEEAQALVEALFAQESAIRDRRQITWRLAERSGGVPFFLVSCARAMTAASDTELLSGSALPWDVRQSIQQRVLALPSDIARRLLEIVTVMGRPIRVDLLEALAARLGLDDLAFVHALDAALRARLLVEASPGGTADHEVVRYRIAHELIRSAILEELGAARSQQLHLVIAEALEEWLLTDRAGQEWAADLAWHFTKAGENARALPYALTAGEYAETVYAYDSAARHYQAALTLARTLGDAPHQAESAKRLGHVLWLLGQPENALPKLTKAAQMYQALGELSGELDVVTIIVQICADRGLVADGLLWAEPLLARAENTGDLATLRARAHLYNGLANLYFMSARYDKQLEAAMYAERLARQAEDDRELIQAIHERILGAWNVSSVAESALPPLLALIPQVEQLRDGWRLYRLLNQAAEAHLYQGEFVRGWEFQERAIQVAQLLVGEKARLAFELGNAGNYSYYLGEWTHARRYCEQALALMQQADPGGVTLRSAYCYLWLGKLDIAEGHAQEGEGRLERALAIASPRGDLQALRHAHSVLAERDLLAGRAAEALIRLQPLLDRPGLQEPNVTMRLLPLVAGATLELGHVDEAAEQVAEAIARAKASSAGFALVDAWRVQALVEIQRENWQAAATALEDAIALAQQMPHPYAKAKALYVSGLLAQAHGEPVVAYCHMQEALSLLHHLGERLYAKHIEALVGQWFIQHQG